MITVADVIALALPGGTRVAAGAAGLGREVTWATRLRPNPPAFGHLSGGELVLLAAPTLELLDERLTLEAAVRQLADLGVAAVAHVGTVTKEARGAADETGVPLLHLPKDAELGPLEREASRLITERRRAVQRRGQEVGRRLMELAIAGEPLASTVRELAELARRPVALEGRDGRLLAYQTPGGRGPARDRIEPLLAREEPDLGRWLRATAASSPADPPTATYHLDRTWSRIVAPVSGRDGWLGSLSLIVPRGEAGPEDALVTSRGAAACAVVLAREQAAASVRREVELHVLDEVLDGALRSETTLIQQAKRLGHDLEAPHVALVARLDHPAGTGPVRAQGRDDRWATLGEVVARAGTPRSGRALWRVRHNSAEIVWPVAAGVEAARIARLIHEDLTSLVPTNGGGAVSLGLGTPRAGLQGIRRSHQEARQALTLGRRLHGPGHLTRFDDLGVYRLIFAAEGLPELRSLHEEALAPLLAYDRLNNAELIRTLDAFFAARCSPKEAATILHVHRNTVLYRLDRVREITGYDLDDANVRLRLQLALHVHLALFAGE
jgi:PucR family transcriptional regulator, purine catabolism regulatory protein